jgi:hypothetical protein
MSSLKEGANVAGREQTMRRKETQKEKEDVASAALGRKRTVIHC